MLLVVEEGEITELLEVLTHLVQVDRVLVDLAVAQLVEVQVLVEMV